MWLGGIASLAVILITAMAYHFAVSFLNQYPVEKTGPSSFACDETIRNAKFESSLKALSVPLAEVEQPIFDALANQTFTLHVDFINTAATCQQFSLFEVIDSSTYPLADVLCTDDNGIMSASVVLPQHAITVRASVIDIQPIGGVRVGISGSGVDKELYTLQKLNFSRTFFSENAETLAQHATIYLRMTKVSRASFATLKSSVFLLPGHQRD